VDVIQHDRLRVNLALRFDAGRSESSSASFTGLGNVKPTVRARLNLGWRFDGPWRVGAAWSADAFGRGGGNFGDVSGGWEHQLSPSTVLTAGMALSAAGDRYMQTFYGISAEQSARSAYPVYEPKAGLRDLSATTGFRTHLGDDWIVLGGAGASRLLGPAARSPLTANRQGWAVNLGLARRF
jgi:MipA family protein